eukprot:TRINITY_DN18207_c0_g1_i1.p1 TRINITY_DN18207_c0_g1~~TRINITY_DN18207_c0_g1_i1.p1  ORF type:complete len:121 (-),score=13.73 TRINITY_DN18207_c0_g1_i1:259-621(-)
MWKYQCNDAGDVTAVYYEANDEKCSKGLKQWSSTVGKCASLSISGSNYAINITRCLDLGKTTASTTTRASSGSTSSSSGSTSSSSGNTSSSSGNASSSSRRFTAAGLLLSMTALAVTSNY